MSGIEYLFNPKSIAVVGISSQAMAISPRVPYVDGHLKSGFSGRLCVVNPKGGDFGGVEVYPSLASIPGPVDYVICCLRADLVPQLVRDCASTGKGAKALHIFSGGFAETGEDEGIRLQREVANIARAEGVRIIGPNCMGIYCPKSRMTFMPHFPTEAGPVGLVSQSGSTAIRCVTQASQRGVRFSKVISYGIGLDLNECDFLENLIQDPETEIIAVYVEGVKDGPRFLRLLKQAASTKPTIVIKGGRTEAGNRAVSSHTASLAGSDKVWDTIFRQTGAIRVKDVDELVDTLVAFQLIRQPTGRGIGVVGAGGGMCVQAADDCEDAGFLLPPYPSTVKDKLRESDFFYDVGASYGNPMDTPMMIFGRAGVALVLKTVSQLDRIDTVLVNIDPNSIYHIPEPVQQALTRSLGVILDFAKSSEKPVVLVIPPATIPLGLVEMAYEARIPIYPTTGRAAAALGKLVTYHEHMVG